MVTQAFPSVPLPSVRLVRDEDLPPLGDPFFYGWREIVQLTNGIEEIIEIPLTVDDVLHPQWGDHVMQNQEHFEVCKDLFLGLEQHLINEPQTVLLHDTLIDWEENHVSPMCPDIAVIRNVRRTFPKGMFSLKQSGGRVDLVMEVTSPSTWKVDVGGTRKPNKVQRYAEAKVPLYVIIDDQHRQTNQSPPIMAYRLSGSERYKQMLPDKRGWYWIETVGLWIGPYGDWVSWYDQRGAKIGTHVEVVEAYQREADARQRAEEQARAEAVARKQAENRASLAEEQACAEADARQRAEEQARAEADAHKQETQARQRAEEQARAEADARKQADIRIQELEAMLRRAGLC